MVGLFSDNRKPIPREVEGSKTCREQRRTIKNRKWSGLSVIAFMLVIRDRASFRIWVTDTNTSHKHVF